MSNNIYQSDFTGPQMDERFAAVAELQTAVEGLQTAVAAKYVKPASGIPSTDLDADVNAALAKALTAVQSLADYYTKAEIDAMIAALNSMEYVDVATLPDASASTMGKIYLVGPDGSGYYSYYITSYDGSAYSWVGPLGTTEISLANYATKAELNQLDQELVDIPTASLRPYSIKTDGTYGTSKNYFHALLPVSEGEVYFLKAVGASASRYCFLTSTAAPASGASIALVSGTSVVEFSAGTTVKVTAPATAVAMLVYFGASSDSYPSKADVYKYDTSHGEDAFRDLADDITINPSSLDRLSGRIDGTVWQNTARYNHILIPLNGADIVTAIAAGGYDATYAFLSDYNTPSNGHAVPIIGSVATIVQGSRATLSVPANAKYIYFYSGDSNSGTAARDYNRPVSVTLSYKVGAMGSDIYQKLAEIDDRVAPVYTILGENAVANYKYIKGLFPGGNYRINILTPNVSLYDTSGNNYRFAIYGVDESNVVYTIKIVDTSKSLADYYDFTMPAGCTTLRVLSRSLEPTPFKFQVVPIEENLNDILSTNPDSEYVPKLLSAKKRYYTSSVTNAPEPLVIAQISDIHANWNNVARFLKWCKHHNDKIDLLVNTGDTAEDKFTSGFTGYAALDGVGSILNVIGNHDTRGDNGWQDYVGTDVYGALIAPFVSGWEVEQPENAATNGYCYYYKDYATQKLRVIVVDIMGFDSTQATWLASVLADAKINQYHVLIATHFAGGRPSEEAALPSYTEFECNYTSLYQMAETSSQLNGYNENAYLLADTVADFIDAGGIFVGYLQGHFHRDAVAKLAKYPEQLVYTVGASKAGEMRDYNHVVGTRDEDEFQIVSIDTYQKTVKLFKVGANVDAFGRHVNSICIDYNTRTIKAQGY